MIRTKNAVDLGRAFYRRVARVISHREIVGDLQKIQCRSSTVSIQMGGEDKAAAEEEHILSSCTRDTFPVASSSDPMQLLGFNELLVIVLIRRIRQPAGI